MAVLVTSKLGAGASTANPLSTITNVVMCESNAVPQEWQPTSRSVEDVFSDAAYLMNRYSGNTEFIARVIRTLAFEQTPDSAISMLKKMYPVVKSAAETVPDENVQTAMCKFWAELCRIPVVQKYFFQRESKYAEVYQLIKSAMRFKDNVVLNITALEALMDVTTIGPEAVTCFYDMKMQNTVKEAIQHHLGKPGHEKYIHTYGVNIFANMALVKSTALGLSRAGVFDTVMKVMRAYPDELEVQRAACRALDKFVVNEEEIASGFRSLLRNDLRVLVCNAIVLGLREAPDDRINRYASNVYALLNNDIDIIETTPGYCRVQ